MGTPPEDEAGGAAESGAVPVAIDAPIGAPDPAGSANGDSAKHERASSLAARIDAAMADDGWNGICVRGLPPLETNDLGAGQSNASS